MTTTKTTTWARRKRAMIVAEPSRLIDAAIAMSTPARCIDDHGAAALADYLREATPADRSYVFDISDRIVRLMQVAVAISQLHGSVMSDDEAKMAMNIYPAGIE